jgi:hypothetical protein
VRDLIGDELSGLTRKDGRECGGYLFSRPSWSWHKQVEILEATETANAQRSSDWLKLDGVECARVQRSLDASGSGLTLSGIWHSHPATWKGDGQPSSTDLESWLSLLDWTQERGRSTQFLIGLIYCASPYLGDS